MQVALKEERFWEILKNDYSIVNLLATQSFGDTQIQ